MMRTAFAYLIYIPLQLAFLPFTLIGAAWVYYKQMTLSAKLGVSSTAVEVINGRWTMDWFDLRKDPATKKLFKALPNTTALGLGLCLFPLRVLGILAGKPLIYPVIYDHGQETIMSIMISRTPIFDQFIAQSLQENRQFVVMGAGYDTRAYGNLMPKGTLAYEWDEVPTQTLKIKALKKAKINTQNTVFIPVDFSKKDWIDQVKSSGLDFSKPITFLWEGVTLYLSKEEITQTLKLLKDNCAIGSEIIADFYSNDFVSGKLMPGGNKTVDQLKTTGEFLKFGVDFQGQHSNNLHRLFEQCALETKHIHYMGYHTKTSTWMAIAYLKI